ncbi:MAG: hypothetical protein GY730_00065 [bacterium]|nr:hypothetical protein [bacterium]
MFIFYDFETSSKELLGQILTYAFLVVDSHFNIIDEMTGKIKLNRTQLPDIEAILTNKLNVLDLQKEGDPENIAAIKISRFLSKQVDKYHQVKLTGYNSNNFDLAFLRNLLIRYGINPYFEGRLSSIDILHYVQHLAFENPDKYRWSLALNKNNQPYYSFKLENTLHKFGLLDKKQSHEAREDVISTIKLVRKLQDEFNLPLNKFKPIHIPHNFECHDSMEVAKQKTPDYNSNEAGLSKFIYTYWLKIQSSPKNKLVVNLARYQELTSSDFSLMGTGDNAKYLRYINHNKHFFILEPLNKSERTKWQPVIEKCKNDPFLQSLNMEKYFTLIKKEWDIEYQIHELGFQKIKDLHYLINKLLTYPENYNDTLKILLNSRKDKKDNYLIQLYNRVYLNYHPDPRPEYLYKYIEPRYITGTMTKNPDDFVPLKQRLEKMTLILKSDEYSKEDRVLIKSLKDYYLNFLKHNHLQSFSTD